MLPEGFLMISNIHIGPNKYKQDHSFKYRAAYWEMSKVALYKQSHMSRKEYMV